jgi:hypothetical protein
MQTIISPSNSAGKPAPKAETRTTPTNGEAPASNPPNREQIANLAYQLYIKSGGQEGRDLENWLQAEELLRQRWNGPASSPRAPAGRRPENRKPENGSEPRSQA